MEGIWDKGRHGKFQFQDLLEEDDDFDEAAYQLLEGDYEGGWGEEDYDPKFDFQLRS